MKTLYEVWQSGHSWGGAFSEMSSACDFANWRVKNPANPSKANIVEVTRSAVEEVSA